MKKVLLSSLMVLAFLITNGQIIINETFSSGTFPPEGWSISAQEGNWSAVNSSYAGGEAPEARLNWSPAFTATSQLIFPAINMSEIEASAIVVSFNHMIDHYSGTYNIGVAARVDGGDWQNVWTQSVNQSIAAENKQLIIEDVDIINSTELEFAIFFSGNSYNINYWYIDDIRVIVPEGFDLALSNVEIPTVFNEILPLEGTVQNIGSESITSFDLNWRINYGSVQTHSYTDLDIPSFNNFDFSLAGVLDLDPGNHNIKVYIDNINGQNTDDNTENNSTFVEFDIASNSVSRRPLFESFTSSTCPPCYSFNTGYFNEFTETNADDITLIKYQMNWPGSGDPYYNDDGGIRRTYYGISAVPSLIIEGDGVSLSEEAINEALEEGKQKPSFAMIESSYTIDGDGVFVFGNILPFANIESAQLHVAVVEKTTYDNAASNGETFFKHVMHKMLPDGNGTSIELNNLETFQFNHQFDMSTTNVEEMEDLIVVVFLQDQSTREIYQSQYAHVADAPVATFNVVNNADKVDINKTFTVSFDQPVKDEDGSTLTPETAANRINFNDVIRRAAVDFTVEINDNKTQFIITPNASLDFSTNYEIEVLPLMGITGAVSTAQSVIFQTRDMMAAPVANFEILNGEENVDVDIPINIHFNQAVRDLNGDELTTETAAERLILRVSDELGEDVPFTVELNGDHTSFSIIPDNRLEFLTQYYVEVLPLMGVDDNLSESQSIVFTTRESIGAPVADFEILDGEENVDVYIQINIHFNQPVRDLNGDEFTTETAAERLILRVSDELGEDVPFTVELNGDHTSFSIIPDNRLEFLTQYYVEVLPLMGVDDNLSESQSIVFTTRESIGAPTVEFNVEDGETDVAVDMTFVVIFSQQVRNTDESEITEDNAAENIVFENEDSELIDFDVELNADNTEFTIIPTAELSSLTTYTLQILPVMGEEDDITDTKSVSFTTEEVVGIENIQINSVAVFPNPANNFITIELDSNIEKAEVNIYDISGKIVLRKTIVENTAKLDVSNIPQGLYVIEVNDGAHTFTAKFSKK